LLLERTSCGRRVGELGGELGFALRESRDLGGQLTRLEVERIARLGSVC
jgi:hypothetical protein